MAFIGVSDKYNLSFQDIPKCDKKIYRIPNLPKNMYIFRFIYTFRILDGIGIPNPYLRNKKFSTIIDSCSTDQVMSFNEFLTTLEFVTLVDVLKRNPNWIVYLKLNLNYLELCKAILLSNSENLQFIENPTKELCLFAVSINGKAIKYIENQKKELCLIAVKKTPLALKYINNPSDDIICTALRKNWKAIMCISRGRQTLKHARIAYEQNPDAYFYIKKEFIHLFDKHTITISI